VGIRKRRVLGGVAKHYRMHIHVRHKTSTDAPG
jgi:hypothetical protein